MGSHLSPIVQWLSYNDSHKHHQPKVTTHHSFRLERKMLFAQKAMESRERRALNRLLPYSKEVCLWFTACVGYAMDRSFY